MHKLISMATPLEQINALTCAVEGLKSQLNYMRSVLTLAYDNEELVAKTETEIQKFKRIVEPNGYGLSLFPYGIGYVYVWELVEGKYYVGYSANLSTRLEQHMYQADGAHWTKRYKPVAILEIIRGDKTTEKQKTLEYMKKKGFENVRGAGWCLFEYKAIPHEIVKYCA